MLLLMISSIIIFFVTTLPVCLRRIAAAYEINIGITTDLNQIVNDTAILTILLSLNYAVSHLMFSLYKKKQLIYFYQVVQNL